MTHRPPCRHWTGSECAKGLHGGRPSPGVCQRCDEYDGPPRGLGDRVERLMKATGVHQVVQAVTRGKDCGCSDRRTALNRISNGLDSTEPIPDDGKPLVADNV